jgi:deoxyribodipyrimidine photo-lyase
MGGLYESATVWLWSKPDHYISVEEINELETVFEKADLATVPDTIFQKEVLLWPKYLKTFLMNYHNYSSHISKPLLARKVAAGCHLI